MNLQQKFEELSHDPDLTKIARRAASSFTPFLRPEEIENCILVALWDSIQRHDDTKGLKFSTYLYRGVQIECRTQQKIHMGRRKMYNLVGGQNLIDNRVDPRDMVDAWDEVDVDADCDLIMDRHLYNMTTKEIAEKRNLPVDTVRRKILKTRKKQEAALA